MLVHFAYAKTKKNMHHMSQEKRHLPLLPLQRRWKTEA